MIMGISRHLIYLWYTDMRDENMRGNVDSDRRVGIKDFLFPRHGPKPPLLVHEQRENEEKGPRIT